MPLLFRRMQFCWVCLSFLGGAPAQAKLLAVEPQSALPPPRATTTAPVQEQPAIVSDGAPPPQRIVRGQDGDGFPERIARLQRTVQSDATRLEELKCLLDGPNSAYSKAESAFNHLDQRLADCKKAVQQALMDGNLELVTSRQEELAAIEKMWAQAKKEFQIAFEQHRAQQASAQTLEMKIQKDREALDRLRGDDRPPAATPPAQPAPVGPQPGIAPLSPARLPNDNLPAATVPAPAGLIPGAPLPAADASPSGAAASPSGMVTPGGIATPGSIAAPSGIATPNSEGQASHNKSRPDPRVEEAEKLAAKSEVAAQLAERDAASITERLDFLRQDIELERKLRAVSASKMAMARDQLRDLNGQLESKLAAGEEVVSVRRQIREAEDALVSAQADSGRIAEHLDGLQTELSTLQSEQVAALLEAETKREQAAVAQQAVDSLNSPFSLHNMLVWLAGHGLTIVLVLIVLAIALWAGRLLENRLVALVAFRSSRGEREERENRAKTLVSVLHNALRTLALGGAAVMILDECGVPVGPILGGAAVVGLAVAFGAQSLIKDYFTGFTVLMEQQYMIGDVIRIGDVTAQVERISLRMTVLRDLQGRVHFIPHGQITTVTNLTHEWSRAVLDIGVAYEEDADQVIGVLLDVGRGLRQDRRFAAMILEDPVMLGVDAFGDSAVVIKFMIKTRPLNQWDVKRELLRRIKRRFDELGIEIPYPHRKLYFAKQPDVDPAAQEKRKAG